MDLSTTYLGMKLRSPLVVGAAAPLSEDLETLKQLEDAGAAAVVLHSVFEEQIHQDALELQHYLDYGTHSFAEAITYTPEPTLFHVGPDYYLEHIRRAKETLTIPIIASLNGASLGGWINFAKQIEQAGADALELNLYWIPTDLEASGLDIETHYLRIIKHVRKATTLPLAVKISPFFSSLGNMAKRIAESGAQSLVLFNRFYQPDIDIENLEVQPKLILSRSQDLRLPMHWIALLHGKIETELVATSGIRTSQDVVRLVMAGATATQVVGVLLRHGLSHLRHLEADLQTWLTEHEYDSIEQLRGTMSQLKSPDPSAFERVQYLKALQSYHSHGLIEEQV